MKTGTLQALGCVGLGLIVGFIAAKRDFTPASRADGPKPTARREAEATAPKTCPTDGCSTGITRNALLLARADTEPTKAAAPPSSAAKKPNIVFIMGDDIGWFNIGAYHRGMMAGKTPHLDRLAAQGMLFTDYYAEASCTAGRAAFISGELPIRTGLTTVGQAGARVGLPAEACTIATAAGGTWATPRGPVQARTIWAISTNSSPPSTGSTSSSAISTISTRWRIPRTPATRRTCSTKSARATWSTRGPGTRTTRP